MLLGDGVAQLLELALTDVSMEEAFLRDTTGEVLAGPPVAAESHVAFGAIVGLQKRVHPCGSLEVVIARTVYHLRRCYTAHFVDELDPAHAQGLLRDHVNGLVPTSSSLAYLP
ncbi:hypothetical protein [Salinibacter ruber]|uniref:Uncharacterized protein n=1 Tax=Salinibacter ruber TaxID=146919 RepID=A0AAW5PBJ8_9BACT|nr:hypothetical protein [Salinibacter ruber]MCS4159254.1 hypothetical protein [Salinibacter ruber]MCS4223738.1 hypothetical protein [Salinibacter ruber]